MALYIPAGRRRRRLIASAAAALVAGLVVGFVVGRSTAPSIGESVSSVRADARQTAAGLRVVVLHDQAGAVTGGAAGDGGTELVLTRARAELEREIRAAVWLPSAQGQALLAEADALRARTDKTSAAFGEAAEALAAKIESTFGS